MYVYYLLCFLYLFKSVTSNSYDLLDTELLENVLDSELCETQLSALRQDLLLRLQFYDSGLRIPKGILEGNLKDLGNYYQCLGINKQVQETLVEGKFCLISIPLNQLLSSNQTHLSFPPESNQLLHNLKLPFDVENILDVANGLKGNLKDHMQVGSREGISAVALDDLAVELGLCVPKACTVDEGLSNIYFNISRLGVKYEDKFCRLPQDKPWAAADYIAIVVFSLIGLLTVLSTAYDVNHTIIKERNPKDASTMYRAFSVYTNAANLVRITAPKPGVLECLDGIRALSIMWIIYGHNFPTVEIMNELYMMETWLTQYKSLAVTAAFVAVDSFFLISGMLMVYIAAGKMTAAKFLRNVHLYYLNRLLRMFPLLATGILLQASLMMHIGDGPLWGAVLEEVYNCRTLWWTTLLYVQNYLYDNMCLRHSWYLSIDLQLHLLSPLVLYWVLRGKKQGWIALTLAVLAVMTASTTYIFVNGFSSSMLADGLEDSPYITKYYMNTLTRASPLLVGMVYGYIFHLWRGKKVILSKVAVTLSWICSAVLLITCVYMHYPISQPGWDQPVVDSIVNSFIRPAWALGLGWVVLACVYGYGGPVNWFLSHSMWKMPSRVSYAAYIIHEPLMVAINAMELAPVYFTSSHFIFRYCAFVLITFLAAFVLQVVVDMPLSVLIRMFLEGAGDKNKSPANGKKIEPKPGSSNVVHVVEGSKEKS